MERSKKAEKILQIVERFVTEQNISCSETIYQSDRVIVNAYEFIDEIVKIAGFIPEEEEEDY